MFSFFFFFLFFLSSNESVFSLVPVTYAALDGKSGTIKLLSEEEESK